MTRRDTKILEPACAGAAYPLGRKLSTRMENIEMDLDILESDMRTRSKNWLTEQTVRKIELAVEDGQIQW